MTSAILTGDSLTTNESREVGYTNALAWRFRAFYASVAQSHDV